MADPITATIAVVGTALGYSSSRKQAKTVEKQGQSQQRALNYEAEQLDVAAGQTLGVGQKSAAEVRRQGDITQSDLVAKVAASGGSVDDPSIMKIIGRNAAEVQYRSMMELYASEDEARTLNARATTARMGGVSSLADSSAASKAIRRGGVATALTNTAGIMAQYWKPPTTPAPVTTAVPAVT